MSRYGPFRPGPLPIGADGWLAEVSRTYENGWFAVLWRDVSTAWGPVVHLGFRNLPGTDMPWRDKMWLKDQLVGPDRLAVEVFPARERLVDGADFYHLWCFPAGFELPFGIHAEERKRNHREFGHGAGDQDRDGWGDGFAAAHGYGPEVPHGG